MYKYATNQKILNRFVLQETLGTGGMSAVYKALDTETQEHIAVKVLSIEGLDELARKRLQREGLALSRFDHENIVGFYGLITEEPYAYCLLELIEGESLASLIERQCRLSGLFIDMDEVLDIAAQIASALVHAHSKNVIHRDLKPDNILLTKDGRAVLSDFGLAQIRDLSPLLQDEKNSGTVAYFAPEQMRGASIDERTDMYQFGLTLYEALTGHLPFPQEHPFDGMYRRIHETIPPPSSINPACSLTLDALVGRCLLPKAQKRFKSMTEVANFLQRAREALSSSNNAVSGWNALQANQKARKVVSGRRLPSVK